MNDLRAKVNTDPAFLLQEYGGDIYRFCRNLAFTKEDGEDLFQDTFLRIIQSPKTPADRDGLRQALYSTALSLWRDRKRKYARRERIAPSAPLEENDVSGGDLEEDLLSREERRLVRRQVDALPEKYRIPTVLFYASEMKVSEIAQLLKLPEGTVKYRLFTARQMVKKGLMEHDK